MTQHAGGTKIYKCTFCYREFNSSTNFYTHRKHYHPKELQVRRRKHFVVTLIYKFLQEMKNRASETQREKRIKAGVEKLDQKKTKDNFYGDSNEIIVTTDEDGTYVTSIVSFLPGHDLPTGQNSSNEETEYTIIDPLGSQEIKLIPAKHEEDVVILNADTSNSDPKLSSDTETSSTRHSSKTRIVYSTNKVITVDQWHNN